MMRFSGLNLIAQAFSGHQAWPEQWPDKAPKASYDVIIVGAGGHGAEGEEGGDGGKSSDTHRWGPFIKALVRDGTEIAAGALNLA